MLRSLTLARRLRPRWPSRLLAVILSLTPLFAHRALKAQTTNPEEISSREVQPTFKLQVERNMVPVRVVVRNAKGETVDSLRKEDFQIFDRGKSQAILNFSLEKPALEATGPLPGKPTEKTTTAPEDADETVSPASAARRFLALYFDDVNTPFVDMARARDAADHFLPGAVQPEDRVALFTSSGQNQVDFTSNVAEVRQALFNLRPRPIVEEDKTCGAVTAYEGHLIMDLQDQEALALAIVELINCYPKGKMSNALATELVESSAMRSRSDSETQSTAALRGIESVVRRLASFPGERSMIIVSGGFLTDTLQFQLEQIIDRALRGGVVINTVDARGLYGPPPAMDASEGDFANTQDPGLRARKRGILLRCPKGASRWHGRSRLRYRRRLL